LNPTASSIIQGNPKRQVFANTFALYGQDAWQVTPKFNVNYGVRYDYEGPVHSTLPTSPSLTPPVQPALPSRSGCPNIYNKFWGAVSPRFGFAYQLHSSTVLRGGYGLYYDSLYIKSILQNNGVQNISVFGPGLNPAAATRL
jgi:outer membrane receptor protein involved in Fe transport